MENERIRIGQRIAEIRKSKGFSQAKLSELTVIGSGHIARIELGKYISEDSEQNWKKYNVYAPLTIKLPKSGNIYPVFV